MATPTQMEQRADTLIREHIGGVQTGDLSGPIRDSSVSQVVDPGDAHPRPNPNRATVKDFAGNTIAITTPAPPPVEEVTLSMVDLRSSVALTSFGSFSLNEMEHAGVCRIVLEAVARRMNESIDLLRENTGVNELERRTNKQIEQMRQNLVAQAAQEATDAGPPPKPQIVEAETVKPEVSEPPKRKR